MISNEPTARTKSCSSGRTLVIPLARSSSATRARVIWGEKDNFVPRSHAETYAKLIPKCSELKIIPGASNSAQVGKPGRDREVDGGFSGKVK